MKFSIGTVRNIAGLFCGFGFGLVLLSPTVSALAMGPVLSLVTPVSGASVSGSATFYAAADSDGLVSIQFKVDGNDLGSAITSGLCRMTFDSATVADGSHTVQVVGQDQSGVMAVSSPVTIHVSNSSPAVGGISVYGVTTSSATVSWVTAMASDSQIEYGTSPSYGSFTSRDWTPVQNHAQTIGGLDPNTTYHFRVSSMGQNGIVGQSGDFIFTTTAATGNPTPTPPVPTPTPPVPTPTPTPGVTPTPPVPTPTPGVTPTPTVPTPTPLPRPTPTVPLGPTPTPTPVPTVGSPRHGSTSLPDVRRPVPQIALTPDPGATGSTGDRRQQPRVIDSGSATTAVARGGSASSKASTTPVTAPAVTPKPAAPIVYYPTATIRKTDVPCSEPDPFKAKGGVGMCVDGKWIALWQPAGGGKGK